MGVELNAAHDAIEPEYFLLAANLLFRPAISANVKALFLLAYLFYFLPNALLAQSSPSIVLASAFHHADALFHLPTLHIDGSTGLPDCLHRGSLLLKVAELGSLLTKRGNWCYHARGEWGFAPAHCLGGILSSGLGGIRRAIEQEEEAG